MVDNHHLFGKSDISTHSAVKNSTRVIAKNRSQSAAQQRPFEPKRRLLDFNESDEILDEKDELDAELTRLMIKKLKQTQTQTQTKLSGESMSSPCSFSSRTSLSSNPLMVQLYLQINAHFE